MKNILQNKNAECNIMGQTYRLMEEMTVTDYSIAFILSSKLVSNSTRKALSRLKLTYPVYALSMKDALKKARDLIDRHGTQVIVSRGKTCDFLQQNLESQVMEMPFSSLNAAFVVQQALRHSEKIVHIGTKRLNHYVRESLKLLGYPPDLIAFYPITDDGPISQLVQKGVDAGFEVFVGGVVVASQAEKLGKYAIEFGVDEQIVELTIRNAEMMLRRIIEEKEKQEIIRMILFSSTEPLVAVNAKQEIMLSNLAFSNIVGCPPEELHGSPFDPLLKQHHIYDAMDGGGAEDPEAVHVIMNRSPVLVNGANFGSVITMQRSEQIQQLEYQLRQSLYTRGLTAKHTFADIIGNSPAMQNVRIQAINYAKCSGTVLISGESGTGKELFAQSIHNASRRSGQPFVAINCASLPASLIESELFGYVGGAFSGAKKEGKIGLFELANQGTLFLDEISEIPIEMQAKLLRAIQEGEILRIGSDKLTRVDVRIICSTNRELKEQCRQGKFREDLYYRICVLELLLPPLRERLEDLPMLCYNLLMRHNKRYHKNITSIQPEVLRLLSQRDLGGNVRELSNLIERMVILATGSSIDMETLRSSGLIPAERDSAEKGVPVSGETYNLKHGERETILAALEQAGNRRQAAARLLGIHPSTLWRKMKKYGMIS